MSEIACPLCEKVQPADSGGQSGIRRCVQCRGLLFEPTGGPRVLIAHASDAMATYVGTVLVKAGFSPLRCANGQDALRLLGKYTPAAAVVDVALDDISAFQLIEHVQSSPALKDTKVVLLASVYRRTAYKRKPNSLYGADDYVEQHHIPDFLPSKLCALLDIDPSGVSALAEESRIEAEKASGRHELRGLPRVRALAHSIVADIALYQQANVEAAAQSGNLEPLDAAIAEGREILASMVDAAEYAGSDPILDAVLLMIQRLQRKD